MFTIWETNYFQLWFLDKIDMRISTAGKYMSILTKCSEGFQDTEFKAGIAILA